MKQLLVILICYGTMSAQVVGGFKHTTVTGNSLAVFQGGFQSLEFPYLPVSYVTIFGQNGMTCEQLLPLIPFLVARNADIVLLYNSTNDVRTGVQVSAHMTCMEQTVAVLLQRNPNIRILAANTPPWTEDNCYGDYRDSIDIYNAAYAREPWPAGVSVLDVWTPNVNPDTRWAIPADMTGPCGIHPGPANQWTNSWAHFTAPGTAAVYQIVKGRS